MKCGDCIHWRKATARERLGYYFRELKLSNVGRCDQEKSKRHGSWVMRDVRAIRCFEQKPVLVKNKCGDCECFYRFPSDRRYGSCRFQLPKASAPHKTPAMIMSGNDKKECCRWSVNLINANVHAGRLKMSKRKSKKV